ncbi:MAG: G1 family endopeptidase [Firmicutes bacterium]|nr:G1 family endopeptidase [Bacillota bacterium]
MRMPRYAAIPVMAGVGLWLGSSSLALASTAPAGLTMAARLHVSTPKSKSTKSTTAPHHTSSTTSPTVDQVSQNWAGLVQEGKAETSVSASWTVPSSFAEPAPPQSAVAEWVGLGGMNASSLIQVGTVTSPGANGTPVTTVFWEDLPSAAVTGTTVAAGTTVTATITPDGTDKWLLELTASGQSKPLVDHVVTVSAAQAKAIESSADWITEAPSSNQGVLPLAPISSTTMTHLMANGKPLAAMGASSLVTIGLAQGNMLLAAPTVNTSADTLTVNTIYGTLSPTPTAPTVPPGGFPGGGFGGHPPFWPFRPRWDNPWGFGGFGSFGFSGLGQNIVGWGSFAFGFGGQ